MPHPPHGRRNAFRRRRQLVVEALEHRLQPSSLSADVTAPTDIFPLAAVAGPAPLTIVDVPAFPGPATGHATRVVSSTPVDSTSVTVSAPRHELYLVGFDVPGRDALVRDLLAQPGFAGEVVELVGAGLTEVTAVLAERSGLDAIHLLTHGAAGTIVLGTDVLDLATASLYSADLRAWGAALAPGGDLLLYGCDVAGDGGAFATLLGELTGADLAASTDRTGAAALGGNWRLETATGPIETTPFAGPAGWAYTLAAPDGLVLATAGTVTAGVTWQKDEVVSFGNPNLALEPAGGGTTGGTFASVLDLSRFGTKGAGVSAIHVVGTATTVGVGSAAMALLPGDILLCADADDTFTGSDGVAVTVTKDEVFWFRPDAAGNYAAGTFRMVLDDFRNWSGADETWSLALVEHDTWVGEALVPGGTFLFSRKGGSEHNDVRMFTPTGVGAGTTSGPAPVVLIEGDDLNYSNKLFGLELVEADTTVGGRFLAAGTLLLSLEADDSSVGTNNIAVTKNDVFALAVTRTSLNGQTAVATASIVFDGSDVGLSGSSAKLTGLALPAGKAAVNRPPVAADDHYSTAVNLIVLSTPLTIPGPGVLANDADPDTDALTAELVTGPASGLLTFNPDGSFTYTAVLNFSGTDSFTYRVTDGAAWSAPATVVINVFSANRPPAAQPDSYTTPEDTPLAVAAPGLLGNDSDPDGDTLAVVVDADPLHGTLVLHAGGGFTYTPAADWSGTDSFTYHATDGSRDSAPVVVTLTVTAVDDPPTLDPLTDLTVAEDGGVVTVSLSGVSAGGEESEPLTVTATSSNPAVVPNPTVGHASPSATGTLTFRPAADAVGTATITVTVDDGVTTTTRTFTVTVNPVNDPPAAADDATGTTEDAPVVVSVLGSDTDADGDSLTVTGTGAAGHGTVTTNGVTVTYTPATNWSGTDSFSYTVSDGGGGTATATVTVTVTPVNDPPVAADDPIGTAEDTPVVVGVLGNDGDPDGDPVTVVAVGAAAHGTVTTDGMTVTYTPDGDWSGSDAFTYTVSDGNGTTATATVSVVVTPVNDAPVAADDPALTNEDTPVVIGVLGNDTDADGDALVVSAVGRAGHGTVTTDGAAVTYTPAPNWFGTDTFTYTVTDGAGGTTTATVTVTVAPVNDLPAAADDSIGTPEDTPVVVGVLANDADADGDVLVVTGTGPAAHGTVKTDGVTVTYTPDADWFGTDTFTYTVSDGNGGAATATVAVTVAPVNDAPVAADDGFVTQLNTPLAVPAAGVLGNDTDVDGDALAAVLVTGPDHGTLSLAPDGSFIYTPDPGFTGTDWFTYRASDGSAGTQPAAVQVRVLPPTGRPVAADDTYSVLTGQVLTVPPRGVLANDTHSGSATLTAVLISTPGNGTVTLNPDGSLTYSPDVGFAGTDSFNYKAVDAGGMTATAHVTIQVLAVNRAPAGGDDTITTVAGQSVVLPAAAALANDADPDGDTLSVMLVGGASHGTVTTAADGSFAYTPDAGFSGTDTFAYRVTDGLLVSGLVQVTVTVSAPPTPVPQPTPADPSTPTTPPASAPQPPTSAPGPVVATPAAPAAPPAEPDPPAVSFAPSASGSFDGPGPISGGPAGTVSPVPTGPGGSIASPRTSTPSVPDAGSVYSTGGGPAAPARLPAEVAPAHSPAAPQPTPTAPTPAAPAAPPSTVAFPPAPSAPAPGPAAPAGPTPAANVVLPEAVLEQLDHVRDELRAEVAERATTDTIVVAGGVAVAGTVLLNTRAVYWFLSALLARPAVWRRFDPLDVIYTWEREGRPRGPGPDDSLQSMVG